MSTKVLQLLEGRIDRKKIKSYLKEELKEFEFLISHMQKSEKPSSWRSAWVIQHIMKNNDVRLQKPLSKIIKNISDKDDGHPRELMKIVRKMKTTTLYKNICWFISSGSNIFSFLFILYLDVTVF